MIANCGKDDENSGYLCPRLNYGGSKTVVIWWARKRLHCDNSPLKLIKGTPILVQVKIMGVICVKTSTWGTSYLGSGLLRRRQADDAMILMPS